MEKKEQLSNSMYNLAKFIILSKKLAIYGELFRISVNLIYPMSTAAYFPLLQVGNKRRYDPG